MLLRQTYLLFHNPQVGNLRRAKYDVSRETATNVLTKAVILSEGSTGEGSAFKSI